MLLVQVGDKQLVVGVAPGRVQTLHVLDETPSPRTRGGRLPAGRRRARSPVRLRSVLQRNPQS
jgi:flagellar protein FliO/FliZ